MNKTLKDEIRDVISGKSSISNDRIIKAITHYLDRGEKTGPKAQIDESIKEQEKTLLTAFIDQKKLWIKIDESKYISEGAEQRVYLEGNKSVYKVNDAIYYKSWNDYFLNLLLHNFFFPDTAYTLKGFTKIDKTLYAVVEQPYVEITQPTDLNKVREFLKSNGFVNIRRNDYKNPELGIIIEDLHDENVLTRNDMLLFIDTVFYLTEEFYE